jgi:hypothetical protein
MSRRDATGMEESSISREDTLSLVDFKWLMAGQGYWLDVPRWGRDADYAHRFTALALACGNVAVRAAARRLMLRSNAPDAQPGPRTSALG